MHHMDVVTTYSYGSLDSDIYTKVPEGLIIPNKNHNCNIYCVKLQKVTLWLKAVGKNMVQPTKGIPSSEGLL